jgi:hypothetical protein
MELRETPFQKAAPAGNEPEEKARNDRRFFRAEIAMIDHSLSLGRRCTG